MVLLVGKFGRSLKFPHRLDNNHDSQEALMASFQAFRSHVSRILGLILLEPNPGSLAWVQHCLEKLPMIDKAFAKLAVDIDYPMIKWKESAAEAYLNYTFNVLELLNKVSSSVSHLSQARLVLSHGLSLLVANSNHLHKIKPISVGNDLKFEGLKLKEAEAEAKFDSPKESIIHEALAIMISTGLRLFGIMISGLCGDVKAYFEVMKSAGKLHGPCSFQGLETLLDQQINQKQGIILTEVKEVNDAAAELAAEISQKKGDAASEILGSKLDALGKTLQGVGKQADSMFSEVMAARIKFLDTIRHK